MGMPMYKKHPAAVPDVKVVVDSSSHLVTATFQLHMPLLQRLHSQPVPLQRLLQL
jgi:hypothetical protein